MLGMEHKYITDNKIKGWTVRGISIGGRHTCIVIDELKICFDLGTIIDKIEKVQTILISHGHMDHIGSLHSALCLRRLRDLSIPDCIMPSVCFGPFKILCSGSSALERGVPNTTIYEELIKCRLVRADDLDKMPLSHNPSYVISSMRTKHKIISFGYCIYNKRHKLKHEYDGLSGLELKTLRDNGVDITYDIYVPEVAFTGDGLLSSFIDKPDFMLAKLLIIECTFLSDVTVEEAHQSFHVHLLDIVANQHVFQNTAILLTHFSDRYSSDEIIKESSILSEILKDKVFLLLKEGIYKI